jgi:hypothetical protein
VLVNAQVRDQSSRLAQDPVRGGGERVMGRRPGDPGVPGRLRRGDPAVGDLAGGLLPQPPGDPAPRRHGGSHSVNVPRVQASAAHFHRRLTHRRSTGSPARRTSRGRVITVSCSREDTVPQSGHVAAAGQSVTVHTSTAPPGPACTSATLRPSTPNSAGAASWNTMPGTAGCPFSAGQVPSEMCSTALP